MSRARSGGRFRRPGEGRELVAEEPVLPDHVGAAGQQGAERAEEQDEEFDHARRMPDAGPVRLFAVPQPAMNDSPAGITVSRNEITGSARVEIDLGERGRPLAYRVTRQRDSDRYVIRDPFGGAIDGVPTLERALEIATGLAEQVREWARERFDF